MSESVTRKLFDLPPEMERLPLDHRGYPVPEFVAWIDGKPDFRIIKPRWFRDCIKRRLCWLCGGGMGERMWFVTGPMCTVTRTTAEPACHRLCAQFAVKNCPFLTMPLAKRNNRDMPDETHPPGGLFIMRNPGVTAIWETRAFELFDDGGGNALIHMGDPDAITYWREGRIATRAEVLVAIETGVPALAAAAKAQGPQAVWELMRTMENYRENILERFT